MSSNVNITTNIPAPGVRKYEIANIGSLTYKNYKPLETEDGKKIYVSPEDEKKILLASKINEIGEVSFENERKSTRRGSRSSDSSYEVPVQSKSNGQGPELEDVEEGEGQVLPTQNVSRHTFPFYGPKRRLFPDTRESKKLTGEEAEQFLKLPPHIQEIKEEGSKGDERRRNFKFPHLFKRSKSNREPEEKGEEIVKTVSDLPNEQFIVKVNTDNTECLEDVSDKCDSGKKSDFKPRQEDHLVKGRNSRGKCAPEKNWKSKDKGITFKTIFGIEGANGTRARKDLLVQENVEKDVEEEEFSAGTKGVVEGKRASLQFPIVMPPRGRWGPKSRRQETKSAPEMHIDDGDVVLSRSLTNKTKKSVPSVGEGTSFNSRSDTESADHGSTDKSSVSKLTEEKQQKRFIEQLLDTIKRKNKDKVADNEALRNLSVTIDKDLDQHIQKDQFQKDHLKSDGIVYAELDMTRSPGNLVRRDDEKTEYAEIIHPKTNDYQRSRDELRKSRENLSGSREHLTEDEGTSLTPDGKKEAAV